MENSLGVGEIRGVISWRASSVLDLLLQLALALALVIMVTILNSFFEGHGPWPKCRVLWPILKGGTDSPGISICALYPGIQ